MWHAVRPTENKPVTFLGSICKGMLPQAEWDALLTEGTDIQARWIHQVDVTAALYRQVYKRFVSVHHLDNLIWVWNTNAPRADAAAYAGFYPGHDVVDILAADVYANDYRQSHHDQLVELADGRPITLGEVGVLLTPKTLENQPQWAWFMTWTTFLTRENDADEVRRLFASPRVLHRGEAER